MQGVALGLEGHIDRYNGVRIIERVDSRRIISMEKCCLARSKSLDAFESDDDLLWEAAHIHHLIYIYARVGIIHR